MVTSSRMRCVVHILFALSVLITSPVLAGVSHSSNAVRSAGHDAEFSGWEDMPPVAPGHDAEFSGWEDMPPVAPGHDAEFSGWEDMPPVAPGHDVEFSGWEDMPPVAPER